MALANLTNNGLYVVLHLRQPYYAPNDFHWGLYHHETAATGGTKYHIRGGPGQWIGDHGHTFGVFKSAFLVGIFHIANVPNGLAGRIRDLITQEDGSLNAIPDGTCLIWLMRALDRVKAEGILKCSDLAALEKEVKDWGNSQQVSAIDAQQPRPLGVSSLCGQL
ncbi:hypothetical protein MMC16_000285 [Acarospora aff. strigata]|nr:hypothetical protein [Acarospora aff. strigata]